MLTFWMKFSIYTPSKVVYLFKYKSYLVSLNAAVLYFSIGLKWKTFIHMMCTNVKTYPNNLNLLNKWYECHFRNSVTFGLLAVLCGLYPGLFLSCDAGHVHERFRILLQFSYRTVNCEREHCIHGQFRPCQFY